MFLYILERILRNLIIFLFLRTKVQNCLNPDKYVLYHLQHSKVCSIPWQDNTVALIVSCKLVAENVRNLILNFVASGGRVLSLCSNLTCPGIEVIENDLSLPSHVSFSYFQGSLIKTNRGPFRFSIREEANCEILAKDSDQLQSLIVKCPVKEGILIISQVSPISNLPGGKEDVNLCWLRDILCSHLGLDCNTETPVSHQTTPAHLFIRTGASQMIKDLLSKADSNLLRLQHLILEFKTSSLADDEAVDSKKPYPVTINSNWSGVQSFDWSLFQEHLTTHHLGSAVFYADTITSTMDFIEGLPVDIGAICITNIQTKGKGRSGNAWLSPRGCTMFSVQLWLDRNSHLGQALPFVQQLATLAVLLAIKDPSGPYQVLDVGLKWPNDLYHAKKVKFGGVLAKSTMIGNTFQCYIGFGVNLNNSLPTVCLNGLIQKHNDIHGTLMEPLRMEVLIARALNHLERLIGICQQKGTDSCLPELYQHWVHRDQKLWLEAIKEEVQVQGVDSCGFLCVQRSKGEMLTLHPDGNSLDQMKNLLIAK